MNTVSPEKEVERLLGKILAGSVFHGKVKAVGGYVRDEYLASLTNTPHHPKDLDILVDDGPEGSKRFASHLHSLFSKETSLPRQMGAGYPIWQLTFHSNITLISGGTFLTEGAVIEFADPMKETYPDQDSRQRTVIPATLEEDIKRRDFTVNMLLKDLTSGEVEDLCESSLYDIRRGILRGHPDVYSRKMFSDDPLRIMRLVRFHAKYGWEIAYDLFLGARRTANRLSIVSMERIQGELQKILEYGELHKSIGLMNDLGVLDYILPEVKNLEHVEHDSEYHKEGDVYTHTMMVLENSDKTVCGQLAALLHDVGKPATREIIDGKVRFIGHEEVSAYMAKDILDRLKFPSQVRDQVAKVIGFHMRPLALVNNQSPSRTYRRFMRDVGPYLDDVLSLASADCKGRLPYSPNHEKVIAKVREIQDHDANLPPPPPLNGRDIMEALGLKSGIQVGMAVRVVQDIHDEYLEKGISVSKEQAISELRERFKV